MGKKSTKKRLTKRDIKALLLGWFEENPTKDFSLKQLYQALQATTHPAKMLTIDALGELVADDYITAKEGNIYRYAVPTQVLEGVFQRKRNGRNSFIPDDGGKPILVFERNSLHALDGDRVRVTFLARRAHHAREAEVIEILERQKDTFVGRLQVEKSYGFLITESRSLAVDIFIPKDKLKGGKTGDKAIVKIVEWPSEAKSPIGRVVDILGQQGENDAEMNAILAEFGLPYEYPTKVTAAAEALDATITAEEIAQREDFREVTTFTIDPKDAKDFDDAISIRLLKNGQWEVGVHIADVSHYVQEGDIIDKEAERRATSIYLVDRTIPMLPERLCNFICSLRPDEEKLAYSCIFVLNEKAEIQRWHLAKTVIRSNRRFTYEEAQYILERHGEASAEDLALPGNHPEQLPSGSPLEGDYAAEILQLNRLAKELRKKRFSQGSIGFDRPEIRFEIDEKGHPVSTYVKIAKDANKLVEEYMLLANRSVAELIGKVGKGKKPKTFIYRVHDVPDPEKLEGLRSFITKFGYKLKTEGSKVEVSKSLNKLLDEVRGNEEQGVIEMVALRAMMKAKYTTENIGHYGLMFQHYTHFTSPIRRYPDTLVHRLLNRYAAEGRSVNKGKYEELCEHSSAMEQLASNAERASIKYKQVEFMADRLGQEFEGRISGITEFGLYVEILENGCEGMIPLRDLEDDYYEFDDRNYCLVGRRNHCRYSLGEHVTIRVAKANLERKQLDFALVSDKNPVLTPVEKKRVSKKPQRKKKRR